MLLHDWFQFWQKMCPIPYRNNLPVWFKRFCFGTSYVLQYKHISFCVLSTGVFLKISGKLLVRTRNPKIDTNLPIQKIRKTAEVCRICRSDSSCIFCRGLRNMQESGKCANIRQFWSVSRYFAKRRLFDFSRTPSDFPQPPLWPTFPPPSSTLN